MRTISQKDRIPKTTQLKKPKPKVDKPQEVNVKVDQAAAVAPIINIDMSKFSADNTAALKLLVDAIKAQPTSSAAGSPKEWEFTVNRDSNNLIKTITAKAK